jgi:hypothetical protein
MSGKTVSSLSARLSNLPAGRGHAPWPDHGLERTKANR